MHRSGDGDDPLSKLADGGHGRLALTRILIWAEQEAESLGAATAATRIREAITALHHS